MSLWSQLDPVELKRLEQRWKSASDAEDKAGRQFEEAQRTSARDRIAYFEKLALFNAASIALVFTFLGSHTYRVEPRWAVQEGLALLVMAMAAAMLRNWSYHRYFFATYRKTWTKANRETRQAKAAYVQVCPMPIDVETGAPVDKRQFLRNAELADKKLTDTVKWLEGRENRDWSLSEFLATAAHLLTAAALVLLVSASIVSL